MNKIKEITEEGKSAAIDIATAGGALVDIADAIGISIRAYMALLKRDPIFERAIAQARETGFTVRAESVRKMVHDDVFADPNRLRVIVDTEKWLLSKLHPRVFGDRIDVTITEKVDLNQAMSEAKQRASRVIDVTPRNVAIAEALKQVEYDPFAE